MQKITIRPGQRRSFRQRVTTFFSICLFSLLLLLFQVAYLQIIKVDEYSLRADRNRVRRMPVVPHRGEIYDRKFAMKLITNHKSMCITLVPASVPRDPEERARLLERLASILQIGTNQIMERLSREQWDIYTPKLIKENVDYRTITKIAESLDEFPGVFWENRPIRVYTLTNTLAHILGYTGYISPEELKLYANRGYRPGSLIGKTGIERVYDLDLRGEEGVLEREVDARNRITDELVRKQPIHGRPLVLTIDSHLQQVAQAALGSIRGAVVVSKPATGEVLAIVSNPGYDANLFYSRIDQRAFDRIQNDPDKPLFNRAIQAQYPPSSVFKLITSISGLESGRLAVPTSHHCDGGYLLGDRFFRCWGTHGHQSLIPAIANSCNVYFYRAGLEINPNNILKTATMFGFGKRTGIDLLGEASGFVPSREWKRETAGRPWLDGDTLNLSIGQGDLLVTPLQVNVMTAAIYNEGIAYRPYLMKEIRNLRYNDVVERNQGREVLFTTDVSKATFAIVKRGMEAAVTSGTARGAFSPRYQVLGKTGTAQNVQDTPHGWFSCFAPGNARDPEDVIAVTVICENMGSGGVVAVPIAAAVLRARFDNMSVEEARRFLAPTRAPAAEPRRPAVRQL